MQLWREGFRNHLSHRSFLFSITPLVGNRWWLGFGYFSTYAVYAVIRIQFGLRIWKFRTDFECITHRAIR